jgi:CheY-like chemotaxis protein/DNA-directed RNA polymerase specialized sigma24 family protein
MLTRDLESAATTERRKAMPYSTGDIAAKLPYLRRYARALTGSQATGDEYVRTCLEVIARDRLKIAEDVDLQTELFRLFHKVYASADPRLAQGRPAANEPALRTVMALPPIERQVLLLSALERYPFNDVAYILDVPEETVRDLFNRAQEAMMSLASAKVLIIEDEPVIALELKSIVESLGHNVVGTADREKEAVAIADRASPNLVLADIQLRGEDSGIEAVRRILEKHSVPVIFITAYPERLLTGKGVEPTFIISKPYDPSMVRAAVSQALHVTAAANA